MLIFDSTGRKPEDMVLLDPISEESPDPQNLILLDSNEEILEEGTSDDFTISPEPIEQENVIVKRGRGRPRKIVDTSSQVPRKRGRPRKNPEAEEESKQIQEIFEDDPNAPVEYTCDHDLVDKKFKELNESSQEDIDSMKTLLLKEEYNGREDSKDHISISSCRARIGIHLGPYKALKDRAYWIHFDACEGAVQVKDRAARSAVADISARIDLLEHLYDSSVLKLESMRHIDSI